MSRCVHIVCTLWHFPTLKISTEQQMTILLPNFSTIRLLLFESLMERNERFILEKNLEDYDVFKMKNESTTFSVFALSGWQRKEQTQIFIC